MKKEFLISLFILITGLLLGQQSISGKIVDAIDSQPIIGASVLEMGTSNGVISDFDGNYNITVAKDAVLEVSYLGMATQTIPIGEDNVINIALLQESEYLDQIIVTAFGIEKEKKAAGFSYSEIDGEELTQAREVNFASQLVGKVAGLDIVKPSNGPSGATRITIRGLTGFSGSATPLIVIDGIPANNSNVNRAGLFGGRDSGDGLSAINPDDIENITVLKGPSASALFGSRGGDGVIVITTKKGADRKGIGVEYTSNFTTESVAILPNFQEEYGQGANGQKPTTQQEAFENWRSWGAKLDGSLTPIFNGDELPYSAAGQDDIRSYYNTGKTWTNGLALTGGNETTNARLSLSRLTNESIVPNTAYERSTINLFTRTQLNDKIQIEGKVNYVVEDATNRINLTDNPSNPSKYFTIGPANLPQQVLSQTRDELDNPIYWSDNPFTLSPYWGPNENVNNDTKNRVLGYISSKWQILEWLSLQGRLATDNTNHSFFNVEIDGTQHNPPGSIFIDDIQITERNFDAILSGFKSFNNRFDASFDLGAIRTDQFQRTSSTNGSGFINPGFLSINNMAIRRPGNVNNSRSRTNGIFGTASFSFNNYLYLEGAVRQDFFSVLTNPLDEDESDNSILYGSGALSFVLSDAITLPEWLGFAKLRLGYGTAGNANIQPYSLIQSFAVSSEPKENSNGNVTFGGISGNMFVNPIIEPALTTSFEVGADMSLLKNRVRLDLTYYDQKTDKHIFERPLPASTGFSSVNVNAGEIQNRGIETLLNIKAIKSQKLSWNISLNFAKNVNKVVTLVEGVDQLIMAEDRTFSANIISQLNGRVGDIWGQVYDRNATGDIIHDENGLPQIAQERAILGNFNPDWYGGITSTLDYRNFSFSFLIDTKQGGEILSTTSSFGYLFGRHPNSLEGRDNPDFEILGTGVGPDGVSLNTTPARIDDFYGRVSSISEENVFDASYIKLRQMSLSYAFNNNQLEKVGILNGLTISLVGRNLYFFTNGLSEIGLDPESVYAATGGDIGIEYAALPSTRSLGFNLKLTF